VKSCLYEGVVEHSRSGLRAHRFSYRLYMVYVDLAELPHLFDRFWLWSARRFAPAWLRRADYIGDPAISLANAVRNLVFARTGRRPAGPIRLLTHLRYFGHCFNPVSFYYVFDERDERIETVVAEITNTPWKERHAYVLPVEDARMQWNFAKQFHVSPFMPMAQNYVWKLGSPNETLQVWMENHEQDRCVFTAGMRLHRVEISSGSLARALCRWPLMTVKVVAAIYWQALRLAVKRVPFVPHPTDAAQ
jgi:uncharacterized protein